ncbi:MAG: hypothetical protein P4K97_10230 [Terracidiphilus sp.]|nr:hypothetical protein [Terracidiphilus sp.]
MKKKRFSVEQMIGVLKQAQVGVPVAEVLQVVQPRLSWQPSEEILPTQVHIGKSALRPHAYSCSNPSPLFTRSGSGELHLEFR